MTVQIESLFAAALGLQAPWAVESVNLDSARHRIDFLVGCTAQRLACPSCGALDQPIHDRNPRSWRHLDFFQFEAWLHAGGPRVGCTACGKARQIAVPGARRQRLHAAVRSPGADDVSRPAGAPGRPHAARARQATVAAH